MEKVTDNEATLFLRMIIQILKDSKDIDEAIKKIEDLLKK